MESRMILGELRSSSEGFSTNVCPPCLVFLLGLYVVWTKTEATLKQDAAPQPIAPAPGPASVPAQTPSSRNRDPSAEVLEPKSSSIKFKMPAPVTVKPEPATPVLPMAPPPVPQRKISIAVPNKKRPRDSDAILGDEVDAISAPPPQSRKKETISPEKAAAPKKARRSRSLEKQSVAPPPKTKIKRKDDKELDAYLDTPDTPVATTAPVVIPPPVSAAAAAPANSFASQPPASRAAGNMPFRMKRAKALVTLLQKEPSAAWVSQAILGVIMTD